MFAVFLAHWGCLRLPFLKYLIFGFRRTKGHLFPLSVSAMQISNCFRLDQTE
jgi:hypothetical protein